MTQLTALAGSMVGELDQTDCVLGPQGLSKGPAPYLHHHILPRARDQKRSRKEGRRVNKGQKTFCSSFLGPGMQGDCQESQAQPSCPSTAVPTAAKLIVPSTASAATAFGNGAGLVN